MNNRTANIAELAQQAIQGQLNKKAAGLTELIKEGQLVPGTESFFSLWGNFYSLFNNIIKDKRHDLDAADLSFLINLFGSFCSNFNDTFSKFKKSNPSVQLQKKFASDISQAFHACSYIFEYLGVDEVFLSKLNSSIQYEKPNFSENDFKNYIIGRLIAPESIEANFADKIAALTSDVLVGRVQQEAPAPDSTPPNTARNVWPPQLSPGGQITSPRRQSPPLGMPAVAPAEPLAPVKPAEPAANDDRLTFDQIMANGGKAKLEEYSKKIAAGLGPESSRHVPVRLVVNIGGDRQEVPKNGSGPAAFMTAATTQVDDTRLVGTVTPASELKSEVPTLVPPTFASPGAHFQAQSVQIPASSAAPSVARDEQLPETVRDMDFFKVKSAQAISAPGPEEVSSASGPLSLPDSEPKLASPESAAAVVRPKRAKKTSKKPQEPLVQPQNLSPISFLPTSPFIWFSTQNKDLSARFRALFSPKVTSLQSAVRNFDFNWSARFNQINPFNQVRRAALTDFTKNSYRSLADKFSVPSIRRAAAITAASLIGTGAISAAYAIFDKTNTADTKTAAAFVDQSQKGDAGSENSQALLTSPNKSDNSSDSNTQHAIENIPNQDQGKVTYRVDVLSTEFAKYIERLGRAEGVIRMLRFVSSQVDIPEIKDPAEIQKYQREGKPYLTGQESEEDKRIITMLAFLHQAEKENYQNTTIRKFISIHKKNLLSFKETRVWIKGNWSETQMLFDAFQQPLRMSSPVGIAGYAPDIDPKTNPAVEKMASAPTFYTYFKKAALEMQAHPTAKYSDPQTIGIETCTRLSEMFKKVKDEEAQRGLKMMHSSWCGKRGEKLSQPNALSRSLRQAVAVYSDGRVVNMSELAKQLAAEQKQSAQKKDAAVQQASTVQ